MGNSGSGLPYEDRPGSDPVSLRNTLWTVRDGNKIQADERGDKLDVSIFRFNKAQAEAVPLAQRNWQKLRTMRHPYIVSVLDGIDLEKELLVVTERVVPLEVWQSRAASPSSESTVEEMIWGFKCILEALNFIHVNCNAVHGYIGQHAIYVAKNGDWKLGAMDLVCNLPEEEAFFSSNEGKLDQQFRSPERRDGSWAASLARPAGSKPGNPYGMMDIYSAGMLFQNICNGCPLSAGRVLPDALDRLIQKMVKADCKKRPTCAQLLRQEVFVSGSMELMSALNELSLKSPLECVEILRGLMDKVSLVTMPVCTFKILPVVSRTLTLSVGDFQNRDSRENCRQMIQVCLGLLAELISFKRIDQSSFSSVSLEAYVALWSMTDRIVRTELLKTLKAFDEILSADTVNKKIFDNMLTGFSDSNAKMREDTLKNLVNVVNKLDERNLQEKLVRFMGTLQGDAEPSIRTNATIFLGKIAPQLKEPIRQRVLAAAFVKAMKDGFVHCRIAGVKAALACTGYIDTNQICGKLMPQACLLLLDQSSNVRELSIELLQACMVPVRENHLKLSREQAEVSKERDQKRGSNPLSPGPATSYSDNSPRVNDSGGTVSAGGPGDTGGGWTSWAVDGLSKTLEKAVLVESAEDSGGAKAQSPGGIGASLTAIESPRVKESVKSANKGWDDMDIDIDDDVQVTNSKMNNSDKNGWGDDDGWMDELDKQGPETSVSSSASIGNKAPKGLKLSADNRSGVASAAPAKTATAKPVKSIGAKKLKVDKTSDNWDDF